MPFMERGSFVEMLVEVQAPKVGGCRGFVVFLVYVSFFPGSNRHSLVLNLQQTFADLSLLK